MIDGSSVGIPKFPRCDHRKYSVNKRMWTWSLLFKELANKKFTRYILGYSGKWPNLRHGNSTIYYCGAEQHVLSEAPPVLPMFGHLPLYASRNARHTKSTRTHHIFTSCARHINSSIGAKDHPSGSTVCLSYLSSCNLTMYQLMFNIPIPQGAWPSISDI